MPNVSLKAYLLSAGAALVGIVVLVCSVPPTAASTFPERCSDIKDADPTAKDGEYTSYVDGDESQPWTAFCRGMNRLEPHEYITVNERTTSRASTTAGRGSRDRLPPSPNRSAEPRDRSLRHGVCHDHGKLHRGRHF